MNYGNTECALFVGGERKRGVDRVFYAEDPNYDAHYARPFPERCGRR